MPSVKPEVLRWARETAGLSLEEAAARIGIGNTRAAAGPERLRMWETDQGEISRPLLLKFAKTYRRPLITFYLNAPPRRGDRGQDFRTLPERHTDVEPLVDALVRDIRSRQAMVRAVLEEEEDTRQLPFIASMTTNDGIGPVLASMRTTLSLDLASFRAQGSAEASFALLRNQVEAAGIFVLLIGNLGSHHTSIPVEAFRGFALADPIAPFVVINDQDAKSAWSFTLLHEVAHLWLGASGVSGGAFEGSIERFCNEVASRFLLPPQELSLIAPPTSADSNALATLIGKFADERQISRSLVAYRLFSADRMSERVWQELSLRFRQEWLQARATQRDRSRGTEGGPNYYVVRRHRLGSALLRFVARNMNEGILTPTRASKVLGVNPRSVHPLLSGATLPVEQGA